MAIAGGDGDDSDGDDSDGDDSDGDGDDCDRRRRCGGTGCLT